MEDASREFRKVHLAHHGFVGSEPLSVALENFMQAGVTLPRLSISGSKQTAFDHESYFDKNFLHALEKVKRDFTKSREYIRLDNSINIRMLGNGALRFEILPYDLVDFHQRLEAIDLVPHLQSRFVGPQRHFLHLTIAAHNLASEDSREEAEARLRMGLASSRTNGLYSVRPADIPEMITEVQTAPRKPLQQ